MRHILTSLALFATFAAAGQTTNPFPYNPDADADGWISVNDLLSLRQGEKVSFIKNS